MPRRINQLPHFLSNSRKNMNDKLILHFIQNCEALYILYIGTEDF